jgi:hypothetical protein
MATLFGAQNRLTQLLEQRREQRKQDQLALAKAAAQSNPRQAGLLATGAAFGAGFGDVLAEKLFGESPEIEAARKQVTLEQGLRERLANVDVNDPTQLLELSKEFRKVPGLEQQGLALGERAIEINSLQKEQQSKQIEQMDLKSQREALGRLVIDPTDKASAQQAITFGADPKDVNELRGTQIKSMSKYGKMAEDLGFVPGTPEYKAKVTALMTDNPDAIKIINKTEVPDAFTAEFGKKEAQRLSEQGAEARIAVNSLTALGDSINLLNNNKVISGTAGEFRLGLTKALAQTGLIGNESVEATEAFFANQGRQVAQVITAFGSGTGLSDADRKYAEKIAGGEISLTRDSLARLLNLQRKYQRIGIENYNKELERLGDSVSSFAKPLEVPQVPIAVPSNARRGVDENGNVVYEIDGSVVDIYGNPVE